MEAIYIYDGEFQTGDAGFGLVKMAAAKHCFELSREFDPDQVKIIRDQRGKPYFEDMPLEFSLTHTGNLWMCMFSDRPCGLDLQLFRECDYEKIARRFFLPEEIEAIASSGQKVFFRIWTRKEAYCKMTGEGFFGAEMPPALGDSGTWQGREYRFTEIKISDDMMCTACTGGVPEIELRILG